jgi:hypothetical protein
MLTEAAATVDDRRADAAGVWLSVSDLAREQRVTKQAISKNITRWAAAGRTVPTKKDGRELLVRVADYKRAAGEVADQAKLLAEQTKKGGEGDPIYTREQARKMGIDADLRQLELDERLGSLIPVKDLQTAAVTCASEIVRAIDQTIGRADELAAAAKIPIAQARTFIKALQRDLRSRAADAFTKLTSEAITKHGSASEIDE